MDLRQNGTPGTGRPSPEGVRCVAVYAIRGPFADLAYVLQAVCVAVPKATGFVVDELTLWLTNVFQVVVVELGICPEGLRIAGDVASPREYGIKNHFTSIEGQRHVRE